MVYSKRMEGEGRGGTDKHTTEKQLTVVEGKARKV